MAYTTIIRGMYKKLLNKLNLLYLKNIQAVSARNRNARKPEGRLQKFSHNIGDIMIFIQLCGAVAWPFFLSLRAKMIAKTTQLDMDMLYQYKFFAIQMFFHCLLNAYGWFCIKKMKWRRGMAVLAITGSLLMITPIIIIVFIRPDPVRYIQIAACVCVSYWDIILLSLAKWCFSRPEA